MRCSSRSSRVDEVVAEEHRERLVADVLGRAQHRVAEALRVALADVVHGGELVGLADLSASPSSSPLAMQGFLELEVAVEVILDRPLARGR